MSLEIRKRQSYLHKAVMLSMVVLVLTSIQQTLAQTLVVQGIRPTANLDKRMVNIGNNIAFQYPVTWMPTAQKFGNAFELISKGAKGTEIAPEARTVVVTEQRLNHVDAVQRLQQIAASRLGDVTYLVIGGWPAFQRQYRAPLPEPTERFVRPGDSHPNPINPEDRMAMHTTTVIAAEDAIIRMDTTVMPKASPDLLAQAEAWARTTTLPVRRDADQTPAEVEKLRTLKPPPPPEPVVTSPQTHKLWGRGASQAAALVGGFSETEAGVSSNGNNLIVGSNGGFDISTNGGTSFTAVGATLPFPNQGDPTIAVGKSGNFYFAELGLPGAVSTGNTTGLTGCSASVMGSGNNGQAFSLAGHAVLYPATGSAMCFPDQEHIAADRVNAGPHGGDQLYAVWRNFTPNTFLGIGYPSDCNQIPNATFGANPTPAISCSSDSGSHWSVPNAIGSGDFPRISVGRDGFAYVIIRDGSDVMVHKYSSCGSGFIEMPGFPQRIFSGINDPVCPLPGLDRCHDGLVVPTLAADDTNGSHLYAAVVRSGSGNTPNDDILIADSNNGGLSWGPPVIANGAASARRFMPWICSAAGNAYVGWYDRRAARVAGASNDLTDFFLGSATVRDGRLLPDGERNLTGTPDPECASGWSVPPRDKNDSESCTVQPQLAGRCVNGSGGGSNMACDFSSGPGCPSGESCSTSSGAPKYGDYNGIACGGDVVLSTWASATPPSGVVGGGGIRVFADIETVDRHLTVTQKTVPAGDPGRFDLKVDGAVVASAVSDATTGPLNESAAAHTVGVAGATGTSLSAYSTSISGDCDSNGNVHFSALHPATCVITSVNRSYSKCTDDCSNGGDCIGPNDKPNPFCVTACTNRCAHPTLQVTKALVPGNDTGKFNLQIDGTTRKASAGNGGATGAVSLTVGKHSVKESAATGTTLTNYTTTFSGDCDASGNVTLGYGTAAECTITNTRKAGTGSDAHLTVKKVLSPANDPGRFNLTIDGGTVATGVGNGGSSPARTVAAGIHTVGETGTAATSLSNYIVTFSGDCNSLGKVTLNAGDNKTCIITNTKHLRSQGCEAQCNSDEAECMANAHSPSDKQACIREKQACVKTCNL